MSRRNGKIQVSDGENFVYFKYGKEKETLANLCKQINQSANFEDLERSLFLFNNFTFGFDMDRNYGSELIISLECDDYFCVSPNNYLEKHKRDSYIELILSSQQRSEYLSRAKKNSSGIERNESDFSLNNPERKLRAFIPSRVSNLNGSDGTGAGLEPSN